MVAVMAFAGVTIKAAEVKVGQAQPFKPRPMSGDQPKRHKHESSNDCED